MKGVDERMNRFFGSFLTWPAVYIVALSIVIGGCGGETVKAKGRPPASIDEISASEWQTLSQKKIYFGHQSVGNNIMDGVAKIMASNPAIKLNVVKLGPIPSFDQPVFAHEEVGKNEFPFTKTKAFRDRIENGLGNKIDIAFLKFCFWDIRGKTDIQAVFQNYKETLSALRAEYPKIKFVHFTIPLMAYPTGINPGIRRILHMPVEWDVDNVKRNELNDLIRREYAGKEPLFDIAAIEATLPDGGRAVFLDHGKTYDYLAPEYTEDGGHLNQEARKEVAEQLLVALARLAAAP